MVRIPASVLYAQGRCCRQDHKCFLSVFRRGHTTGQKEQNEIYNRNFDEVERLRGRYSNVLSIVNE